MEEAPQSRYQIHPVHRDIIEQEITILGDSAHLRKGYPVTGLYDNFTTHRVTNCV